MKPRAAKIRLRAKIAISEESMRKQLGPIALAFLLAATGQPPSWAGKVLERIEQTGTLTAGTRKDAIPFAYLNDRGEWVGYSLDILELIRQNLERQVGKPIELRLVEVTPQDRFAQVRDHRIDIECSSTTVTWAREREVDFTVSYFASGTQVLASKGSGLNEIESLAGKRIGVIPQTTNESVLKTQQPAAQVIPVKDREEGLKKLETGEIDGFASDGITLQGLRQKAKDPQGLEVVPDYPYQYESYACMVPEDESAWRDTVNYSLVKFMDGMVSDRQETVRIYEKWFGEEGVTPYPREAINDYFQGIVDSYEWIPWVDLTQN